MILDQTHYGLKIFSSILREYYPGETVLSIVGKDCKPTKNPFNENKCTLSIHVIDCIAKYMDLENAIPVGDVFDFAARHYNLQGNDLLSRIIDDMHLRREISNPIFIERPKVDPVTPVSNTPKVIIPVFSYFYKPISNIIPTKSINIIEVHALIKGSQFATCTDTLRNLNDIKTARSYKANNFDYVTFSGTFSKRNDANLIKHSGLITIDFDHINNIDQFKNTLLKDEYFETELLFKSPSGDGLKWIIPIDLTKAKHKEYFKAVSNYIRKTYDVQVDNSGQDTSRACFLPHDADVFINPKYL
jgi:hypothetical protein